MENAVYRARTARWKLSAILFTLFILVLPSLTPAQIKSRSAHEQVRSLSAAEFSGLIRNLSEEGGFFQSDNFTSNETSYLHVVGKLRDMRLTGGAYIGVGPEQNFTYIAKLRPKIAFIVDIRRQAVIQHLLYKALFQISENRVEFLANLLSRPIPDELEPDKRPALPQLLDYFDSTPPSGAVFSANLTRVRSMIRQKFQVPLSEVDQQELSYVYSAFEKEGLGISFHFGQSSAWGSYFGFPTLRQLILQPDLDGKLGNFLASDEDYLFVRDLQRRNRIIPIVGDFAGSKALVGVGDYLHKHGYTVTAFYTSNVEEFLFRNEVFDRFVRNVRHLPINSNSIFIRAVSTRRQMHPAQVPGHRIATILEKIPVFLADYDSGTIASYRDLVTKHYIAGP